MPDCSSCAVVAQGSTTELVDSVRRNTLAPIQTDACGTSILRKTTIPLPLHRPVGDPFEHLFATAVGWAFHLDLHAPTVFQTGVHHMPTTTSRGDAQ